METNKEISLGKMQDITSLVQKKKKRVIRKEGKEGKKCTEP